MKLYKEEKKDDILIEKFQLIFVLRFILTAIYLSISNNS